MRVEERLPSRREAVAPGHVGAKRRIEPSPFLKVLNQEQQSSSWEEMQQLLQKLDEQGNRLVHSRTLIDLNHYKKLVFQILERSVGNGIQLTEKRVIDAQGHSRIYRHVEEINERLVQLTDDMLKRESSRLEILEKIGQIKGLLIQLNA